MRGFSFRQRATRSAVALSAGVLVAVLGPVAAYAQQALVEQTTEFEFSNPRLTVRAGQPVRITVNNAGMFPHTIAFDDAAGASIAAQPAASGVAPGASGVVDVTFANAGTFEFWCPVGTHRDRGMIGTITVAGAQAGAAGRAGGVDPLTTAGGLGLLGTLALGAGYLRRRRAA
jgi:uncharacterized cupredoxin-like copper-binding protein